MNEMIIYITGASGYLGKTLTDYFANQDHTVIALCRRNIFNHKNIVFSKFNLGSPIEKTLPPPDICIHCAYDLSLIEWSDIFRINVIGSQKLFDQLLKLNCKSIINISSISAFKGVRSKYGKSKLLIEEYASKIKGISILLIIS